MEPQGEFEQRPEVKPAEQIPFSKPKASKTPWIVTAILFVVVLGLAGYLVYDKVISKKNDDTGSSKVADKDNPEKKPEEKKTDSIDAKVNEIIDLAKKEIDDSIIEKGNFRIGEAGGTHYVMQEGYITWLDKSVTVYADKELSDAEILVARDIFAKVLKDEGFEKKDVLTDMGSLGTIDWYYTNEEGFICEFSQYGAYLACAHETWIADSTKDLVYGLITAYKKGYSGSEKNVWLYATEDDIKDGSNKPYQTIKADLTDAYAIFYRKGTDGEWVYVFSGNGIPLCEEFLKTEDMRKAFEGQEVAGCTNV